MHPTTGADVRRWHRAADEQSARALAAELPLRERFAGPLAPKTMLNVHQTVRKALGDSLRKGLVVRNVALAVDPPRVTASPEQRCWTEDQLRRFQQEPKSTGGIRRCGWRR